MPHDLAEDAALLRDLATRDPLLTLADAEARVASWAHGNPSRTHRDLPLVRERGTPTAVPRPGLPAERHDVRVFGLDERGRVVLFDAIARTTRSSPGSGGPPYATRPAS